VARTTSNPRLHRLTVRLTDDEQQALEIIRRERGFDYLNDALRSLIPTLRLGSAEVSAAQAQELVSPRAKRRRS
jgi:hypothetical protein